MILLKASNMLCAQSKWGADDAYALTRAAQFFSYLLKDAPTADAIVDRAIAVNPNSSEAWRIRGFVSINLGQHEPAIEQFQHAMRLNPVDPQVYYSENGLAIANFFLRRFEIALSWAVKSMARQKTYAPAERTAMNCYAMLGRIAEAQSIQVRLRQVGTMTTISRVKTMLPFKRQEDADLWLEAHRIAGVPE